MLNPWIVLIMPTKDMVNGVKTKIKVDHIPSKFTWREIETIIKDDESLKRYMHYLFVMHTHTQPFLWVALADGSIRKYTYVRNVVECRTYDPAEQELIQFDDNDAKIRSQLTYIAKELFEAVKVQK